MNYAARGTLRLEYACDRPDRGNERSSEDTEVSNKRGEMVPVRSAPHAGGVQVRMAHDGEDAPHETPKGSVNGGFGGGQGS